MYFGVCQLWLSGGDRVSTSQAAWKGFQPGGIPPFQTTTFANSAFLEGSLGTALRVSSLYSRLKPQKQSKTDRYNDLISNWFPKFGFIFYEHPLNYIHGSYKNCYAVSISLRDIIYGSRKPIINNLYILISPKTAEIGSALQSKLTRCCNHKSLRIR